MTAQELAQIHARFFHPEKSPCTSWRMLLGFPLPMPEYIPKHKKYRGRLFWDSKRQGTLRREKNK